MAEACPSSYRLMLAAIQLGVADGRGRWEDAEPLLGLSSFVRDGGRRGRWFAINHPKSNHNCNQREYENLVDY